jgi:hypothetical protein
MKKWAGWWPVVLLLVLGLIIWQDQRVPEKKEIDAPAPIISEVLPPESWEIGDITDVYRGVPVFHNGLDLVQSHGRHYSPSGYYYGQKWQCVEFIKRFYFDALGHAFPDVMGHAKDFFDEETPHGGINPRRNLLQFRNGGLVPPAVDDLIVFNDGYYGHVAIICAVHPEWIEIVQQNIFGQPRASLPLRQKEGGYWVGDVYRPAGWLRVPKAWPESPDEGSQSSKPLASVTLN